MAVEQLPIRGLTTLKKLGQGAFGTVYSARDNATGQMLVVKKIPKSKVGYRDVVREVNILRYLEPQCRPYILCYSGFRQDAGSYYISTEFIEDSAPLDELIKTGSIDDGRKAEIVRNMLRGLAVIHERGVAHRDIKPANIMVSRTGTGVKFIDFGVSCMRTECRTQVATGTPLFMAPEVWFARKRLTNFTLDSLKRTDLWSLGLTIWELIVGKHTELQWRAAAARVPRFFGPVKWRFGANAKDEYWRDTFLTNFNYNSPTDLVAAQNRFVERKLADLGAPSIRPLLMRNNPDRSLPRTAGAAPLRSRPQRPITHARVLMARSW